MQSGLKDELQVLNTIVQGVVNGLGYVGAMVATCEPDDTLPVRAYFINPKLITEQQIKNLEQTLSKLIGIEIGLVAPIARAYLRDERFEVI